jgi:hypothetical protein
MIARLLVCILGLGFGVVSACGGAAETGLFNGESSGADSGGGADGSKDGSGSHDSAAESSAPDLVACPGTSGCKVGMQVCCRKGTTMFEYQCGAHGSCSGDMPLEIPCDKQRDCDVLGMPGAVCCVTATTQGASDVTCRMPSDCTLAQGRTPMCDPAAPTCMAGTTCKLSAMTVPGYSLCL